MDVTNEINRQLLECPVCCESYNVGERVPRVLVCGHCFCTTCLKKILTIKSITCPLCQAVHEQIDGDVDRIPKDNTRRNLLDILNKRDRERKEQKCTQCDEHNKATHFCNDCEEYICNECTDAHKRTKLTKTHVLRRLSREENAAYERQDLETAETPAKCLNEKHLNNEVFLFCVNCDEEIYETCASEKHAGHHVEQLNDVYSERCNEMKKIVSRIRQTDLRNKTERLKEMMSEANEKGEGLKQGLANQFGEYRTIIDDRLKELKCQIDKAVDNKTLELDKERGLVLEMQHVLSEADAVIKDNSTTFLKKYKSIRVTLTDLQKKVSNMPENQEIRYNQACTTEDFSRIVHALGSIHELRQDANGGGTASRVFREATVSTLSHESSQRVALMDVLKSLTVSDDAKRPYSEISNELTNALETPETEILFPAKITDRNIAKSVIDLLQTEEVKNMVNSRFKTWRLKGYWTVKDGFIEVFSRSSEETEQCMHLLKETVMEKTLKLWKGSEFIVESDKWQIIIRELKDRYADQVRVEVNHTAGEVVVYATCTLVLKDTCDVIRFFLRDNQMKTITLRYEEPVIAFIMRNKTKLGKIRDSLSQYCLNISQANSTTILLKAIGFGVGQAVRMVHAIAFKYATVNEKDRFDSDNENNEDDEERFSDEEEAKSEVEVEMHLDLEDTKADLRALGFPGDDKLVYVVAGDITNIPVEAVVNPADRALRHNGGLAKALVEKGGRSIQEECTNYIQRKGNVELGQVFCSDSGTLSCSVIIHAVGPKWVDGKSNEKEKLFECVTNCLKNASRLRISSIAFPAVSAGSFKFPLRDATLVITKAVLTFWQQEPHCSVREIYFCDKELQTVKEFVMALRDSFENDESIVSVPQSISAEHKIVKPESNKYVRQLLFI